MKTYLKVICIILATFLAISLGATIYFFIITKDANLDKNKLINIEKVINFYDANNNFLFKEGDEKDFTNIEDIPLHVQNAFIAVEDKRFYTHNGVDFKGLMRATLANIKTRAFTEGGSTISQQLIKNTHLSNEKTFKRKLIEFKLARKLEKEYDKKEILEKYLNTIYFGDNCYGITMASKHYFGKKTSELTIIEGATLAGIIKAPSYYSPYKDFNKCNERKRIVLTLMNEQGYINKQTYDENISKDIEIIEKEKSNDFDFAYIVKKELNEIIKDYPFSEGNLNIYTTIDLKKQEIITTSTLNDQTNCDKSSILINKEGEVKAYYSTCGEIPRQIGSTIKPILVYAPAIENDVVYSCTPILDEKKDYNGYSPSNYNDKYYGYVSVKESLAKSLNSCAVQILNYTEIEKAKSYLEKMDFPLTERDNSLCLALGATEKGATLIDLISTYSVFLNSGSYSPIFSILKVESQKSGVIYQRKNTKKKIFSEETVHLLNDMLETTVTEGTAKKLSFLDVPLCSKTGTVGNEKGNLDAYNISYNSELLLGVWFGNKDNTLMDNSILGGTQPTILASKIWEENYKDVIAPKSYIKSARVCEKYIDKIELEEKNNILLANDITPARYATKALFKNNKFPKVSERFSSPNINSANIKVVNGLVQISLNIPDYYEAYIYRQDKDQKIIVYDTLDKDKTKFIDKDINSNNEYLYSIIPYFKNQSKIIKGNEIYLDKIKTPTTNVDEWWADEFD